MYKEADWGKIIRFLRFLTAVGVYGTYSWCIVPYHCVFILNTVCCLSKETWAHAIDEHIMATMSPSSLCVSCSLSFLWPCNDETLCVCESVWVCVCRLSFPAPSCWSRFTYAFENQLENLLLGRFYASWSQASLNSLVKVSWTFHRFTHGWETSLFQQSLTGKNSSALLQFMYFSDSC